MIDSSDPKYDDQGSVLDNYEAFGVVSNPNFLGVRSRISHIIESESFQVPPPAADSTVSEFDPVDSGSDLEEDSYSFLFLFLSIGSIHSVFFAEDDQIAEDVDHGVDVADVDDGTNVDDVDDGADVDDVNDGAEVDDVDHSIDVDDGSAFQKCFHLNTSPLHPHACT
ncbi:hypothetical protein CsSME_00023117 [Camellia sinensis var. sinensis]